MTTKEWLSRGRHLQQRIQALEESKALAYTAATSTTASTGGGGGSNISRTAERYSELSETVDRERERLDSIMAEITALIAQVEDNTLAALLQDRYVRCLTWEQVATELNYNQTYVIKHLHPKALQAAKDAIECHYSDVL